MEKKLSSIEFRCDLDLRDQVDSLSLSLDTTRSEFVRVAVEREVSRHRAMYESLHTVFASTNRRESDKVVQE
jgi:predicted transcriptional regulator